MRKLRIIAFIAAVVAGFALYSFLNLVGKPAETPKTSVVVAAQDIPANTTVTEAMLAYSDIPNDAVLSGAVTDAKQVVGKVFNSDVLAGEQIVSRRLVEVGTTNPSGTLAYLVAPGKRAITISVDDTTGLNNMIRSGNTVDIIVQYGMTKTEGGANSVVPAAKILVQDVPVLAVDNVMDKGKQTADQTYTTLTLSVSPEEAVELSYAAQAGTLRAILRSPLDKDTVGTDSVTSETIQNK